MKAKAAGLARNMWRRTIPRSLRRTAWELFAHRYFDRRSIKKVVAYARTTYDGQVSPEVQQLVTMLEQNGYRPDFAAIEEALGLKFKSYSLQDLIAYLYFNGKKTGFYIDVGAFDGVAISNTYALEELGWDGICIEPLPEAFAELEKNRRCFKYNVALSNSRATGVGFLKVSDSPGLSGLETHMPDRIRGGLEKDGRVIEHILVDTVTFDDVMENHPEMTSIDFLSIDVEGAELIVLDTIDFGRYRFELITIENNPGGAVLREYMGHRGYELFLDLGVDQMFVPGLDD